MTDTRTRAIVEWREFCKDPVRVADVRRHALDLIAEHFDGELAQLSEAEREQYLTDLSTSLGDGLLRYIGYWIINDFAMPDEWRAGRE